MRDKGSFRDPSGFIFLEKEKVLRIVNENYKIHYDHFINSELYSKLSKERKIVSHKDFNTSHSYSLDQYKVLEVEKIPFISYPYEWSFSQFKKAALITLEIQKVSIEYGMTLKDATPFNIQFLNNKPIFIDTLSFENIEDANYSWKPYKQFCEMFLSPLCLMSFVDPRLNKLLTSWINGIPAEITLKLFSFKHKIKPSIFFHFYLPYRLSKSQQKGNRQKSNSPKGVSKKQHLNLIDQLIDFVTTLKIKNDQSEWGNYLLETTREKSNYVTNKEKFIRSFIGPIKYDTAWDIGSNDGHFSEILSEKENATIYSMDIDWKSVDGNFLKCNRKEINNIYPLILDLSNPSPSIGWMNQERGSIFERLPKPELIICLALIHHIINLNIPIEKIIELLNRTKRYVILEFVPIEDPKCQQIFASRIEEIRYPDKAFLIAKLKEYFKILEEKKLNETNRTLFLLEKR